MALFVVCVALTLAHAAARQLFLALSLPSLSLPTDSLKQFSSILYVSQQHSSILPFWLGLYRTDKLYKKPSSLYAAAFCAQSKSICLFGETQKIIVGAILILWFETFWFLPGPTTVSCLFFSLLSSAYFVRASVFERKTWRARHGGVLEISGKERRYQTNWRMAWTKARQPA